MKPTQQIFIYSESTTIHVINAAIYTQLKYIRHINNKCNIILLYRIGVGMILIWGICGRVSCHGTRHRKKGFVLSCC